MDNQHRLIAGYRDLTEEEIALINACKGLGEQMGELVSRVEALDGVDRRWASIARTDLQKGLMALVRSIAKPTTF
jgi:hypothetical protein